MAVVWLFFDYGGFWDFGCLVFVLISDCLGKLSFGDFVATVDWFSFLLV